MGMKGDEERSFGGDQSQGQSSKAAKVNEKSGICQKELNASSNLLKEFEKRKRRYLRDCKSFLRNDKSRVDWLTDREKA